MEEYHGFVVQNSVIPLDLSPSKNYIPVVFITSLNNYVKDCDKEFCDRSSSDQRTSVIFWEYYDADRETFENNIFEDYEQNVLKLHSNVQIKSYLKICKIMGRCCDLEESLRIFSLLVDALREQSVNDSQLIVDFLETVCITYETISSIFVKKDNLKYLDYLLFHLSRVKRDLFGFWTDSSRSLSDCNLISQYLFHRHYDNASIAFKYGLQWKFCESVFIDYCKAVTVSSWTVDMLTHFEGFRSIDRFFLIIQTFFLVKDCKINGVHNSLEALLLAWRSIPDAFVTPQEMIISLRSLASPSSGMVQDIAEITELYSRLFWDSKEEKSPRALKDLCRCTIRRRLSENFQLPYGLSELNLPYRVQMFLKLEI